MEKLNCLDFLLLVKIYQVIAHNDSEWQKNIVLIYQVVRDSYHKKVRKILVDILAEVQSFLNDAA
jgi:hypothetical protein